MKKLPISIQTFEKIREEGKIYVDKTMFIHQLVSKGKYYFLARPRRFGKSLMLTTLKSYFQGKKHLFEGLYIYEKEKEWKYHPVVHIDYSLVNYRDGMDIFHQSLMYHLKDIAREYDIELKSKVVDNALSEMIVKLHEKYGLVVVLVDEYDKPMVDALTKPAKFEENRNALRGLYGALKGLDQHLRFVMLTGVSRFAKVNVFSGMNNLDDITLNEEYSTLTGFTQEELESYFGEWVEKLNKTTFQIPHDKLMGYIKFWYDGFSFTGSHKLYNPFSILALFSNLDFGNYWFSTGTPTFLTDLIKEQKHLPETFENLKIADLTGSSTQLKKLPLVPLLYQTGYLTVSKVVREGVRKYYHLNYPNEEVRHSFLTFLAAGFVEKDEFEIQPEAIELRHALRDEKTDAFVQRLQSFLADIPYQLHIPAEAYYHSLVYIMLRLAGVQLLLEKSTDKGRIDAVAEWPDKVYIIEFKFAKNSRIKNVKTLSRQALPKLKKNGYAEPYLASGKKVILFGIGFLEKVLHGRVKVVG